MKRTILTMFLLGLMAAIAPLAWGKVKTGDGKYPYFGKVIKLSFYRVGISPAADIDFGKGKPRTPVCAPRVLQDGHTLYFPDEADYWVCIYTPGEDDEEMTQEYATAVAAEEDSIALPNGLQGTLAIEVVRGSQHFWGEIELE